MIEIFMRRTCDPWKHLLEALMGVVEDLVKFKDNYQIAQEMIGSISAVISSSSEAGPSRIERYGICT